MKSVSDRKQTLPVPRWHFVVLNEESFPLGNPCTRPCMENFELERFQVVNFDAKSIKEIGLARRNLPETSNESQFKKLKFVYPIGFRGSEFLVVRNCFCCLL